MTNIRMTRCCLIGWLTLSFAVFVPLVRAAEDAQSSATFGGIGVSLQMEAEGAVYPTVVGVLPGGAAAKSGIGAGDRLVGIVDEGGKLIDFQGKSVNEITALVRGPSGSTLRLVVEPKGSGGRKLYELIRQIIQPSSAQSPPEAQPAAPFGGIGASIGMQGEGAVYPTVEQNLPGGAAAKSGIGVGDRLVGVVDDGGKFVDFQGRSVSEIVALLRGPSGSTLRLVVESKGSGGRKLYELIREIIKPSPSEPSR